MQRPESSFGYRGTLEEVLRLLVEAGEWPTLQAVTEMVFSTAQRLRDARGPPFVGLIGVLDAVMELAARVTVDAACLELAQRLSCLAEDEDWRPESLHRQLGKPPRNLKCSESSFFVFLLDDHAGWENRAVIQSSQHSGHLPLKFIWSMQLHAYRV